MFRAFVLIVLGAFIKVSHCSCAFTPSTCTYDYCSYTPVVAELVFHCDNVYELTISSASRGTCETGRGTNWQVPGRYSIQNPTSDTKIEVICTDHGVVGGFIGQVTYQGQEYYTNDPYTGAPWHMIARTGGTCPTPSGNMPIKYNPKNSGPWGAINTAGINNNADWLWADQCTGTTGNAFIMYFTFSFASIVSGETPLGPDFVNDVIDIRGPSDIYNIYNNKWFVGVVILCGISLLFNIVIIYCYCMNWKNKGQYKTVKYMDSDDNSELNQLT